jgi:hypothetical protein
VSQIFGVLLFALRGVCSPSFVALAGVKSWGQGSTLQRLGLDILFGCITGDGCSFVCIWLVQDGCPFVYVIPAGSRLILGTVYRNSG